MIKNIFLTLVLCACWILSACAINHFAPTGAPEKTCAGSDCSLNDDTQVSYTKTAADYKEFGERTPRDQNIVTNSTGSNVSSSIPPTIDEEMVAYEEEVVGIENNEPQDSEEEPNDDPVEDWLAEEGQTLKSLLTEWSDRSGWRLVWKTNRNYPLTAGAMFRGRYADVSAALIRTFARARPAPIGTFYKGNRVLVVETMEDENAFE